LEKGLPEHMKYIIGGFTLFYLVNGLYYLIGIFRIKKYNNNEESLENNYPFVSIIVAARNEANSIEKCINCLLQQEYPSDRYEIVAVNDASTDSTMSIINSYRTLDSRVIIVDIPSHERKNKGKNNAIDKGIEVSKGKIIITTDADVWMGAQWLTRIVHAFDNLTGVIIGITLDKFSINPVHLYQALDSGSINIISVALAAMKHPITCQGSNLAFRRSAYLEVRDRILWLSDNRGNHEWQMQEIDIATNWGIKPLVNPESFVYTYPPDTWKALLNQRIRWASTGKDYTKFSVRFYLTLIYFSLLSFIVSLWVLTPGYLTLIWGVKLFTDLMVAISVVRVIRQPKILFAFPLVYILQPFLIVITTFLGSLRLYKWK